MPSFGGACSSTLDDCVLVAGKIGLIKKRSGAMHQPVEIVVCIRTDAFAVKAHEERSRACSIKAPVVIENANLQTVMFLSRDARPGFPVRCVGHDRVCGFP